MGQDTDGNLYRNGDLEFFYAQEGITSFTLKAETTSIYGESSKSYAFRKCTKTLKTVNFPVGSKLEIINTHAFYYCSKIKKMDLTNCLSLEKICDSAFSSMNSLTSLLFPVNLKIIGNYVVSGTQLTSINIPKNLVTFGRGTFASNPKLQTVIFETGTTVKEFDDYVFERSGLTSFDLPPSLEKLTVYTLWENPTLKSITAVDNKNYTIVDGCILSKDGKTLTYCAPSYTTGKLIVPEGVETITHRGFYQCKAEEIVLPESLTKMENNAFAKSELKRINIPSKLKIISYNMFANSKLEDINIPSTITTIEDRAFAYCKNLTNISIPASVQKFSKSLFEESGLTSITIPNGVNEIRESCFLGCSGLKEIVIPETVKTLGGGIFSKCPNLTITFGGNSAFSIDNQRLIKSKNGTQIIQFIGELPDTIINISKGVDIIKEKAFFSKPNLIGVIFESNDLQYIDSCAFMECTNLEMFSFPKSVIKIATSAFEKTKLSSIHFGPNLEYIGEYAFRYSSNITDVTFDDSETLEKQIIDREAFNYCRELQTIKFSNKLTFLGLWVISNTKIESIELPYSLETLVDKSLSYTNLKNVTFKKTSDTQDVVALKNITDSCFEGSNKLEFFEFANGIEHIGLYAFKDTALKEARLPPSIRTLEEESFSSCHSLEVLCSRENETALELFEIGVVLDCPKLRYINFNNDNFVTKDEALFTNGFTKIIAYPPSSPIHHIYIPGQVQDIYPKVFYCCFNLWTVMFPDDSNLTSIGFRSFYNCSNLQIINIPQKVNLIGNQAFEMCKSLQCGLIISNPNIINSLIKDGKMPFKCVRGCRLSFSRKECSRFNGEILFMFTSNLLTMI